MAINAVASSTLDGGVDGVAVPHCMVLVIFCLPSAATRYAALLSTPFAMSWFWRKLAQLFTTKTGRALPDFSFITWFLPSNCIELRVGHGQASIQLHDCFCCCIGHVCCFVQRHTFTRREEEKGRNYWEMAVDGYVHEPKFAHFNSKNDILIKQERKTRSGNISKVFVMLSVYPGVFFFCVSSHTKAFVDESATCTMIVAITVCDIHFVRTKHNNFLVMLIHYFLYARRQATALYYFRVQANNFFQPPSLCSATRNVYHRPKLLP